MDSMLEDEILTEQFTRNVQFFGKQGQLKVAKAFVVVIGLGVRCLSKLGTHGTDCTEHQTCRELVAMLHICSCGLV